MSRRKLSPKEVAAAAARYLSGESAPALAQELEVGESTLRRYFREANIGRAQAGAGGQGELGDRVKHRSSHMAIYRELDDPPEDPLSAMGWLRRIYLLQLKFVATDPDYPGTETQRRKEIRELGAAAARCRDEAALAKARDIVLGQRKKRRQRGGAEIRVNASGQRKRGSVRVPGRVSQSSED